jgi:transketolase
MDLLISPSRLLQLSALLQTSWVILSNTALRPADGNEVSGAYLAAFENRMRPSVLILTRQNLPHLEGSSIENTLKGAYTLVPAAGCQVILAATGSEVSLAFDTSKLLKTQGVVACVVSMPSWELFEEQTQAYKESVFPKGIPVVSVEAMTTLGWAKYAHYSCGINTFGTSAPYQDAYRKFGLVPEVIAEKVGKVLKHYETAVPEWKMQCIV